MREGIVVEIREKIISIFMCVAPGKTFPTEVDEKTKNSKLESLAFLQFIIELESAFGIEIDAMDVTEEDFSTVESVARFVKKKSEKH